MCLVVCVCLCVTAYNINVCVIIGGTVKANSVIFYRKQKEIMLSMNKPRNNLYIPHCASQESRNENTLEIQDIN